MGETGGAVGNGAALARLSWDDIREPGAYVDVTTGNLYRVSRETLRQDAASRARLICDYLAGMTDGYAARTYKRLFSPDFGSINDL